MDVQPTAYIVYRLAPLVRQKREKSRDGSFLSFQTFSRIKRLAATVSTHSLAVSSLSIYISPTWTKGRKRNGILFSCCFVADALLMMIMMMRGMGRLD